MTRGTQGRTEADGPAPDTDLSALFLQTFFLVLFSLLFTLVTPPFLCLHSFLFYLSPPAFGQPVAPVISSYHSDPHEVRDEKMLTWGQCSA